jgi:hypothetical protein
VGPGTFVFRGLEYRRLGTGKRVRAPPGAAFRNRNLLRFEATNTEHFACNNNALMEAACLQSEHRVPQDRGEVRGPHGGRVRARREQGAAHHPKLHLQHDRGQRTVLPQIAKKKIQFTSKR